MIEKLYCLRCDECGEVINYWQTSSIEKAIRKEKINGEVKITKRVNGMYHLVCQDCVKSLMKNKNNG